VKPFVYETVTTYPKLKWRAKIGLQDGKIVHVVLEGRTKGQVSPIEELIPGDVEALERIRAALEDPASFGHELEQKLNQVFRVMGGPEVQWLKGETT
jgi:hypothetical protein